MAEDESEPGSPIQRSLSAYAAPFVPLGVIPDVATSGDDPGPTAILRGKTEPVQGVEFSADAREFTPGGFGFGYAFPGAVYYDPALATSAPAPSIRVHTEDAFKNSDDEDDGNGDEADEVENKPPEEGVCWWYGGWTEDGEVANQIESKRYPFDFLLQFRDLHVCDPEPDDHEIPDWLCVKQNGRRPGGRDRRGSRSWREEAAARLASTSGDRERERKRPKRGRKTHQDSLPPSRLEAEPPVQAPAPSATSWVAQVRATKDTDISKQVRSILNKITEETFERLQNKLFECGLTTEFHVRIVVGEIFQKATTQHHFTQMYTKLCVNFHDWCKREQICENENIFKRILVDQCQDSFEDYLTPPDLDDMDEQDRTEALSKFKEKMLGNMKFAAQLMICRILSSKVIFFCADTLLQFGTEETLETLGVFLKEIGPTFDTQRWNHFAQFDNIFATVSEIAQDATVSKRIRFLLQDVLDLRAQQWKSAHQVETPMKLDALKQQWSEDNGGRSNGKSVEFAMRKRY